MPNFLGFFENHQLSWERKEEKKKKKKKIQSLRRARFIFSATGAILDVARACRAAVPGGGHVDDEGGLVWFVIFFYFFRRGFSVSFLSFRSNACGLIISQLDNNKIPCLADLALSILFASDSHNFILRHRASHAALIKSCSLRPLIHQSCSATLLPRYCGGPVFSLRAPPPPPLGSVSVRLSYARASRTDVLHRAGRCRMRRHNEIA